MATQSFRYTGINLVVGRAFKGYSGIFSHAAAAAVFEQTGTIWEFYEPRGGDPRRLARKPHTEHNTPCPDYLGHTPLIALARLWGESR